MPEPPVAADLLPVPAGSPVPDPDGPFAGPTVPFPALLLDRAMPRLSDTEWRLVCVVVRQTLGWHDKGTGGRKQKDWLTQAQLVARTGRTAKPVAQAVAALTAKQVIQVLSDRGEALLTPEQRRRCRGRHWFQLHPQWRNAWPAGTGGREGTSRSSGPRLGESPYGEGPHAANGHEENGEPEGDAISTDRSALWAEARRVFTVEKVHTTKETGHKYINPDISESSILRERRAGSTGFLHSTPRRDPLRRHLPTQAQGSGEWGSRQTRPQEGGNVGRQRSETLTIHGPSNLQARGGWEQEAAGHRWAWRKDISKWVPYDAGTESEKPINSRKATEN